MPHPRTLHNNGVLLHKHRTHSPYLRTLLVNEAHNTSLFHLRRGTEPDTPARSGRDTPHPIRYCNRKAVAYRHIPHKRGHCTPGLHGVGSRIPRGKHIHRIHCIPLGPGSRIVHPMRRYSREDPPGTRSLRRVQCQEFQESGQGNIHHSLHTPHKKPHREKYTLRSTLPYSRWDSHHRRMPHKNTPRTPRFAIPRNPIKGLKNRSELPKKRPRPTKRHCLRATEESLPLIPIGFLPPR